MTSGEADSRKVETFIQLFHELSQHRAKLDLVQNKDETGSEVVAVLLPHNPRAARIDARLELDFGVYLKLGRASPFEIPLEGGYYTKKDWMSETRSFCLAVINGHFREKLIFVKNEIRGSDHTVELPDGHRVVEHWRNGIIIPWSHKSVQDIQYEPY